MATARIIHNRGYLAFHGQQGPSKKEQQAIQDSFEAMLTCSCWSNEQCVNVSKVSTEDQEHKNIAILWMTRRIFHFLRAIDRCLWKQNT